MYMKKLRIAFFDSKPYDIESFDRVNSDYGFEIKYFQGHISIDTVEITKGYDALCIFVNDNLTAEIADVLAAHAKGEITGDH